MKIYFVNECLSLFKESVQECLGEDAERGMINQYLLDSAYNAISRNVFDDLELIADELLGKKGICLSGSFVAPKDVEIKHFTDEDKAKEVQS